MRARNLAWGFAAVAVLALVTGCSTSPMTTPDITTGGSIAAAALSNPYGTAGIRVSWNAPSSIPSDPQERAGYVVGYELYRSTSPAVGLVATNLIAFLDGGRSIVFIDDFDGARRDELVTVTTDDSGIVQVTRDAGSGTPNISLGTDTITYDMVPTQPTRGTRYYYAVRVVTKKLAAQPFDDPDNDPLLAGVLWVSRSYGSRQVTGIAAGSLVSPPDLPDPGSRDIDLTNGLFEWEAVAGADTYVLELCTDRSFPSGQVVRSTEYLVSALAGTTISRLFQGADAAGAFENWSGPIYWRVGARRVSDGNQPVDEFGRASGYVFGAERAFQALESPPAP